MHILNLLLDKDVFEKLTLLICPSTIGLKDVNYTQCSKARDDGKVCEVCWRKAIMRQNKKVEEAEKANKKEIIVPEKLPLQWCIKCGCKTVHANGKCLACKAKI